MELPPDVTIMRDPSQPDRTWYVIGTAHVSQGSVDVVRKVIEEVKPDTVCVELCKARYEALVDRNRWQKLDIFKVIKEGKSLFLLANLAVGAYQRRLGAELGIKPGAELLEAVQVAKEAGSEICLVDRDIHITLKRTWANVPFLKKFGLLGAIIESLTAQVEVKAEDIERLKEAANLSQMMEEFSEALPAVKEPLIDERDIYLAAKTHAAPGTTVVAVVGAAHVPGMSKVFSNTPELGPIEQLPPPSVALNLLKWVVPALVLGAFWVGISKHSGTSIEDLLWAWALPNAVWAGLFTAIAGGKLLTIIAAGLSSPVTSLNPLVNTGMVAGLVEAWLRKPTVEDAERINEDVQSLRGYWRNPFTRVLMVTVLAALGSALGAWLGVAWLLAIVA